MKIDINKFRELVAHNLETFPEWRYGQALFNTLYEMHPSLANEIRGSDIDPFHKTLIAKDEFWEWLIIQEIDDL